MNIKSAKYDKPRDDEGKIIDGSDNCKHHCSD